MSEGNASVEVAVLKGQIAIDLGEFQEALEKAQSMFETFAENVDQDILIKLDINDEDLNTVESQVKALRETLSGVTDGDINENINSEGSEETIEELEKIKDLENEISNQDINIEVNSNGIEPVITNLDNIETTIDDVRNKVSEFEDSDLFDKDLDINVQVMLDNLARAVDQLHELKIEIGDTSHLNIDDTIDLIGINKGIEDVEELKERLESISKEFDINIDTAGITGALTAFGRLRDEATDDMEDIKVAEEETEEQSGHLSESLGSAIYAFQAVFQAAKQIAVGSIEQFGRLQMSARVAGHVFGSFGNNVRNFATTSLHSLGLSSGATMQYADKLGFALKAQGATSTSAGKMAEQLVKTADNMVLASGGSMTMQQAVQTLTSAIGGQTYGLKALGINVTGVNKKWTPLNQAMYIMHQVMQKVNKNFGSLSGNLNTTSGQMQVAKSTIEQFGESIGKILAPQLAHLNKFLGKLYNDFEHLSPKMKRNSVIAGEVGVGFLGIVATVAVLSKGLEMIGGGFETVIKMVTGLIPEIKEGTTVFEIFTGVLETNPIIAITTAIIAGVVLLYEAWKHNWDGMRGTLNAVWTDLQPIFVQLKGIIEGLLPVLRVLGDAFGVILVAHIKFFIGVLRAISPMLKVVVIALNVALGAIELFVLGLDRIIHFLAEHLEWLPGKWGQTAKSIAQETQQSSKEIVNTLNQTGASISKLTGITQRNVLKHTIATQTQSVAHYKSMASSITQQMRKIRNNSSNMSEQTKERTLNHLQQMKNQAIFNAISMQNHVSHETQQMKNNVDGYTAALQKNTTNAFSNTKHNVDGYTAVLANNTTNAFSRMKNNASNSASSMNSKVSSSFNGMATNNKGAMNQLNSATAFGFNSMLNTTRTHLNSMTNKFNSFNTASNSSLSSTMSSLNGTASSGMGRVHSTITNSLNGVPKAMSGIGGYIVAGLAGGMSGGMPGLLGVAASIASSVVSTMKKVLDIHSPAREVYRQVGQWILPGISTAMEDGLPALLNTITNQVHKMVDHMQKQIKTGVSGIEVPIPTGLNNFALRNHNQVNVPWGAPTAVNNNTNINTPVDGERGNIQTTGIVGGQTNNFTINESNNATETANQVIHQLRLGHFGLA